MALFTKKQKTFTHSPANQKSTTAAGVPHDILLRPRVTEKATLANDRHTYVFEVPMSATKRDVAVAVRELYKVTPRKVTVVRMRPQKFVSRMRGVRGQKRGFKKAYVHLNKDETIDVMK